MPRKGVLVGEASGDRPGEIELGGRVRLEGILAGLQELAAQVGVEVRIEPFELKMAGKGGLCRINKKRVILVDANLSVLEQIGVLGEALGKVVPKGVQVALPLQPYLKTGHGKVGRLVRPRPLARGR